MILTVLFLVTPPLSQGQSVPATESPAPARIYHLLRENDDWSFLADPAERREFWDPVNTFVCGPVKMTGSYPRVAKPAKFGNRSETTTGANSLS